MENIETRGRKPKDTVVRETKITIKISEDEMERIEKIAKYSELPKTVIARNLLLFGLDEMEGFRRVGLLHLTIGIIKTSEWLENIMGLKKRNSEKELDSRL